MRFQSSLDSMPRRAFRVCASQSFRACQARSAGFPTCRIADFQSADRPKAPRPESGLCLSASPRTVRELGTRTFQACQARSAGFPTCRIADFQSADRPKAPRSESGLCLSAFPRTVRELGSRTFQACQARSAGFPTCRIADFQSADRPKAPRRLISRRNAAPFISWASDNSFGCQRRIRTFNEYVTDGSPIPSTGPTDAL